MVTVYACFLVMKTIFIIFGLYCLYICLYAYVYVYMYKFMYMYTWIFFSAFYSDSHLQKSLPKSSSQLWLLRVRQPFWFLLLRWLWCCLEGDGWLAPGRCDVSVQRFHWLPGLVIESCEVNGPDKMNTVIRADPLARRPRWQTGVLHC